MLNDLQHAIFREVQDAQSMIIIAHQGKSDVQFSPPFLKDGGVTFEWSKLEGGDPKPDWRVVRCKDWNLDGE